MKIDIPKMDFDILSIPDPHFEPKIDYKALEEIGRSRDEYMTTLRDAILSIDKQQQAAVKQLEQQSVDSDKKHKQSMRKANWQIFWAVAAVVVGIIAAIIGFVALLVSVSPNFADSIKNIL